MTTANSRTTRPVTIALLAWALATVTGATLRLNFERAPAIHVRWAPSVNESTRAELERRFALAGGQQGDSGSTWVYFLTSPSADNILALITHPAVEDTHNVDRGKFVVSPSAPRRGPYITTGPRWVPTGLQALTAALILAGALALSVIVVPPTARFVVEVFSPAKARISGGSPRAATLASIVMFAALILTWILYLRPLRSGAEESAGFRVGDWLVSYEFGLVRRGLLGLPILSATTLLSKPPETIVLAIQVALYTLLFLLLFILARPKRLNVWFLVFLFSPAGLLFPLYEPMVMGRKDVLFFVAFALYACWMPRPDRAWTWIVAFALGAATTLAHEMFFFFTPYFFVMRFFQTRESTGRRFAPELSLFAGSLLALVVVSTVGANMHGDAQCASLLRRGFEEDLCNGIMRYPVTTLGDSIRETAAGVRARRYYVAYPIAAVLAALPLVPLFALTGRRLFRPFVLSTLAALAFTLPMFVIALDWGRLLNIHVMAIAVVIAAFLLDDRKTPGAVVGATSAWLRVAIVLAVGWYLTGWSIRHCCDDPLRAGLFQ